MVIVRRWLLAIVGRTPLGIIEALVLVVTGGGVLLTIAQAGFIPAPTDPLVWWGLWWLVVAASGLLILRVFLALGAVAGRIANRWVIVPIGWWAHIHLPFEVRSPVVRKVPSGSATARLWESSISNRQR